MFRHCQTRTPEHAGIGSVGLEPPGHARGRSIVGSLGRWLLGGAVERPHWTRAPLF